jgi:predicted transcriptional regulator of viral defense system
MTGMILFVMFPKIYIFVYKQNYMWIEFQEKMRSFRVFSIGDVEKQFPSMNLMNLVRWQRKGYILKLRNRWYAFNDAESHENIEWLAANLIYSPSYVSLHTALSWYDLIPEMIVPTTSVSSRKTNKFSTPLGNFDYHRIKQELFGFGYSLEDMDLSGNKNRKSRKIMVATPQKAILDFFYINSYYSSEKEMEDLRLNNTMLAKIVNKKFYQYLERYQSRALESRIRVMTKAYGL